MLHAMRERLMKTAPLGELCEARTQAVNERAIAQSAYRLAEEHSLNKSCCL